MVVTKLRTAWATLDLAVSPPKFTPDEWALIIDCVARVQAEAAELDDFAQHGLLDRLNRLLAKLES